MAEQQRRYSNREHGQVASDRDFENLVFKPNSPIEVWRPSWKNTLTTVRVLPAVSPVDGRSWDPWRLSADDNDFGDWVRTYPAIRGMGQIQKCSYLLYDPTDRSYDPAFNPTVMFYRNIKQAVKSGAGQGHWVPLLEGGENRSAALPEPGEVTLLQCLVYQHNSKVQDPPRGWSSDDRQVVLELSISAKWTFYRKLNERTPGYTGAPDDYHAMFTSGDIVDLNRGAFVRFCQEGSLDESAPRRTQLQPGTSRRDTSGPAKVRAGYECHIFQDFGGFSPRLDTPGTEEYLRGRWKPWDEYLRFLTHREQVQEIAKRFPADMVAFAFRDTHRELVPDHVWTSVRNRVQSGYTPPVEGGPPANEPRRLSPALTRTAGTAPVTEGMSPGTSHPGSPGLQSLAVPTAVPGVTPTPPAAGDLPPGAQPPVLVPVTADEAANAEKIKGLRTKLEEERERAKRQAGAAPANPRS